MSVKRRRIRLETVLQREAEMMDPKYATELKSTVTGLVQNERKVVRRM